MIPSERIHALNAGAANPRGRYILYWMQQAQRAAWNHALEYAIREANARGLPVVVGFGLAAAYPSADERPYAFMLEGLAQTRRALEARGIAFVLRLGEPDAVAAELALGAALAVTDRGYMPLQRRWRERAARAIAVPLIEVESDVVVPVETASSKAEFAARTLRPRIHRQLDRFLVPLASTTVRVAAGSLRISGEAWTSADDLLGRLQLAGRAGRAGAFTGGAAEGARLLRRFLASKLADYGDLRNDLATDRQSHLSAYLHFGQVSALEAALAARSSDAPRAAVDAFLEQLIVRRELAMNFAWYEPRCATFAAVPAWARTTLAKHAGDRRPHLYPRDVLEAAATGDPYWNAAQRELLRTGAMHNYMRMYWGKKILEWSASPEEAFDTALAINDRWALDGRDPNSCAGVAWCFGAHDRPWTERPVFGTVRYMNAAGLDRKFAMADYVARHGG